MTKSKTIYAHCYRSGEIVFSVKEDIAGCIALISGPDQLLREKVSVLARLAHDNKTLLVPGLPEAESGKAAIAAVVRFRELVSKAINTRLPQKKSGGK